MLIFSRYSWWAGAMVAFAVFLAIASQVGVLSPFRGLFLDMTSPIQRGLSGVFDPVATYLADAGEIGSLRDENAQLRSENERLQNEVAELQADRARIEELEGALGIVSEATTETLVPATVIYTDYSPFTDVRVIDRGSADGIQYGMTVVSSQRSLVGTVVEVTEHQAEVRLISDSRSRVNAEIESTRVGGSVRGGPDRVIEFSLAQGEVKVGDQVVTSGLGNNYPKDIPIGTVSAVSGTPQDLFRDVEIEPRVRLSTVETVLVITSFVPQRIDIDE